MACFGPLTAYYGKDVNPVTGRRPLVFRKDRSHSGIALQVPCGQCIGCKLERSRQWAMRCLHEMKMHSESAFVTLTYEDSTLPAHGSLHKRHLQLFMKRLRKQRPTGLRFYGCGEYGGITGRPHYHVLLLNTCFSDMKKRSWGLERQEHETYASAELRELWPYGENVIGEVNFETCAYVARYCTKVVTGDRAAAYYGLREPEFAVMSRRPGLGLEWFRKYHEEAYAHDSGIINSRECPLTRYYDGKFELLDSSRLEDIKLARRRRAVANKSDNTSRRRWTKEQLAIRTMEFFVREKS